LAPELLISGAIITPFVDIFSLGICVYEMATDFKASNELWQNIINDTSGLFDKISKDLKPLLSLMLSKEPQLRISASGCLKISERLQNLFKECHYADPAEIPIDIPGVQMPPRNLPDKLRDSLERENSPQQQTPAFPRNNFIMIEEMEEISSDSVLEQLGKVRKKLF